MRKLLVILLLITQVAQAQSYTPFVLTSGNVYGQANNKRMAGGEQVNGNYGWLFYVGGIDDTARTPANNTDYSGVAGVTDKGPAMLAAAGPFPNFHIPGTVDDSTTWNIMWIVVSSDFTTVPTAYIAEMVKRVCNLYGTTTDTTKMGYIGYSLGGCGGLTNSKDPYLASHISVWYDIGSGCNISPNYQYVADKTSNIKVYASKVDGTALPSISRNFVNGVIAKDPVHPIEYVEFDDLPGTDHVFIRFVMNNITAGASYLLSNGDTWTLDVPIYEDALKYSTKRKTR